MQPSNKEASLRDPASERAVLSGVCAFGGVGLAEVSDLITPSSFMDETHSALFSGLSRHLESSTATKLDFHTVVSAMATAGLTWAIESKDNRGVVSAILNYEGVELASLREHAGRLRKLEFARQSYRAVERVADDILNVTGGESLDEIVSRIEGPVMALTSSLVDENDGPKLAGDKLEEFVHFLAANERQSMGLPSGFRNWDKAIGGGLRRGSVNVVGARMKVGKSFFATNVALRVATGAGYDWPNVNPEAAVPVLHLDTENTDEDQRYRRLAMVSRVETEEIELGSFGRDRVKYDAVLKASRFITDNPYYCQRVEGQSMAQIEATMRRWVRRKVGLNEDGTAKDCLVVFDYLKVGDDSPLRQKNVSETQVLGFMMTSLYNFAVKYGVPILLMVQLNKDGDVAMSDRIAMYCTNLSHMIEKTPDEQGEDRTHGLSRPYNRKLVPVHTRQGKKLAHDDFVNIDFRGERAFMSEGPLASELRRNGVSKGGIKVDSGDAEGVSFGA